MKEYYVGNNSSSVFSNCTLNRAFFSGKLTCLMTSKNFIKNLSTSLCTTLKQPGHGSGQDPNWRTHVRETQIISQVSAILLQRQTNHWETIVKSLLKIPKLTPPLFLRILHRTRTDPEISMEFFNWAKKNLRFEPDLKTQCKMAHLLFESGFGNLAKPILFSAIQAYPSSEILNFLCRNGSSDVCSSVLKGYCQRGMYGEALGVYLGSGNGVFSIHSCNSLLHLLHEKDENRLAWCFYGAMIRNGVLENQFTWPIVARILRKEGKFERIDAILNMGINSHSLYDLIIQEYCVRGDFDAAFVYVGKMFDKRLEPGFAVYSTILDGACRCGDGNVIEMVMEIMVEKGYVMLKGEYDSIIRSLAHSGKTSAAKMVFDRACAEEVELENATYGSMLRAFSENGGIQDATEMYHEVLDRKMVENIDDGCFTAFADALCRQEPSSEVFELLKDVIEKGFHPQTTELSKHVKSQCGNREKEKAENLLHYVLDRGIVLDPSCCSSLVKHYCSSGQIDAAIELHDKMKGGFDVETYNAVLTRLFEEFRVHDAVSLFEDMKLQRVFDGESFVIMVRELCNVKELRQAMKVHDEMLKLGLKPDARTYKNLISGFG